MVSIPFAGTVNDLRNANISNFMSKIVASQKKKKKRRICVPMYMTKHFHTCQLKLKKIHNNSFGAVLLKIKETLFYFLQGNKENNY